jgi:hypothetical protein
MKKALIVGLLLLGHTSLLSDDQLETYNHLKVSWPPHGDENAIVVGLEQNTIDSDIALIHQAIQSKAFSQDIQLTIQTLNSTMVCQANKVTLEKLKNFVMQE